MRKTSLFSPKSAPLCPKCGAALVIRRSKQGAFFGCSHYPQCDHRRPLKSTPESQTIKRLQGQHCPQCQSTLELRQGRFGMFICCEHYPQCPHSEAPDKAGETAIACPQCASGRLVMRHTRYGKTFYGCNRYPACQFALNDKPVAGVCRWCQYPLLLEKLTAGGTMRFCASKQCAKPDSE